MANTPSAPKALKIIQELAQDSGRIIVTTHGKKRQRGRQVSHKQIQNCLLKGTIEEGPFINEHGNWQVSMLRHAAGEEMRCVVVIEESGLIVRTVIPLPAAKGRRR